MCFSSTSCLPEFLVKSRTYIFLFFLSELCLSDENSCCFPTEPETQRVPNNTTAVFYCIAPQGARHLVWLIDGESANICDPAINISISNGPGVNATIEITALQETDNISVRCTYQNRNDTTCISSAGYLHIEGT